MLKVLGMTADNASANDTMIDSLAQRLPEFCGKYSRARCFDHIVNLCAKSVLRPFDIEKKRQGQAVKAAEKEIEALLADIDLYQGGLDLPAGVDGGDDDNEDGFVDEREEMDEEEREELDDSILPVKLLLTKVWAAIRAYHPSEPISPQIRTIAYKITFSSTILLPAWHDIVVSLELPRRVLPRDVRTRWNSTFQMLDVALKYREAIDKITSSKKYDLRDLELDEEEWTMAAELLKVLKVSTRSLAPGAHARAQSRAACFSRINTRCCTWPPSSCICPYCSLTHYSRFSCFPMQPSSSRAPAHPSSMSFLRWIILTTASPRSPSTQHTPSLFTLQLPSAARPVTVTTGRQTIASSIALQWVSAIRTVVQTTLTRTRACAALASVSPGMEVRLFRGGTLGGGVDCRGMTAAHRGV